jgi:hypothetical protein
MASPSVRVVAGLAIAVVFVDMPAVGWIVKEWWPFSTMVLDTFRPTVGSRTTWWVSFGQMARRVILRRGGLGEVVQGSGGTAGNPPIGGWLWNVSGLGRQFS